MKATPAWPEPQLRAPQDSRHLSPHLDNKLTQQQRDEQVKSSFLVY